jgi:hypothetical protein
MSEEEGENEKIESKGGGDKTGGDNKDGRGHDGRGQDAPQPLHVRVANESNERVAPLEDERQDR